MKKVCFGLLIVFAMQFVALPGLFGSEEGVAATPGLLFEDSFETYSIGNAQAPWSNASSNQTIAKVTIANDPGDSSRGKVLRIEHLGTTPPPTGSPPPIQVISNLATGKYSDQTGTFVTEYDFYISSDSLTALNYMMYSREVSWPYAVGLSATITGTVVPLVAPTGSGSDISRSAPMGQWHRAKIETDVPNQKYRFSVDDSTYTDWVLFRPSTATPPVTHANIFKTTIGSSNASGAGNVYVDNILMYNPAVYVPPTPSPSPTFTPSPEPMRTIAPVIVPTPAAPAGYAVYEPLNLPLQLADTVYSGSLGSDTGMFVRKQDAFNTYIEVNTNATSKNLLTIPFSSGNDITTVSFDYKPAATTSPFYFNVKGSAGGTGPDVNVISLPLEGTTIKSYSFGSITDFNTVQIRISKSLSVYDMYIGGVKCNASPLPYTNAAAAATLKGIVVSTPAGSGAFRGSFDNFMVYAGEPLDVAKKGVTLSSVASGLLASSSSVTLATTATNTTGKALTAALIAIVRNGAKVEDIKIVQNVNVGTGISKLCSIPLNIPNHKGRYSVSVMLWDNSFASTIPVAQTKVLANPYSAVYLSSRWYRANAGDQGSDISTLDAIKRFMATGDKWSYITDNTQIQNITALDVSFQGALNVQTEGGYVETLEGKNVVAPWMTWQNAPYWSCVNRQAHVDNIINSAKTAIDAGATEFQHDDATANYGMLSFAAGCFCADCITSFRNYLKNNLTSAQITELGIANINTFDYKQFVLAKGITTDSMYKAQRSTTLSATNTWFIKFQKYATLQYYEKVRSALTEYAGKNIAISANMTAMSANGIAIEDQVIGEAIDYGISEHNEPRFTLTNIVSGSSVRTSIGTRMILSPVPEKKCKELVRPAIAQTYAMGQYMLVPWDIWLPGTDVPRYFGTVEEYGDLYQFIRENSFLFDGYEMAAKVGVLVNWADITKSTEPFYEKFVMDLYYAGVPFRVLIANYNSDYPLYSIQKEQLSGLEYILTYSDINSFSADDKACVQSSPATLVSKANVNSNFLGSCNGATAQSISDALFTTIRRGANGNTSLHILSDNGYECYENISVTIKEEFVSENPEAWLYRPGKIPQKLPLGYAEGKYTASIDSMEEWAIISFTKRAQDERGSFILPKDYLAFHVGNPAPTGSAIMEGGRLLMKSSGKGFNISTQNDTGKQDSLTYTYKCIEDPLLRDYSVSAALEGLEGYSGSYAGIMLRENVSSNATFIALKKRIDGRLFLEYRMQIDESTTTVDLGLSSHSYLKISKIGTNMIAYTSADGIDWTSRGAVASMVMRQATAGAFTLSSSGTATTSAVILGLKVIEQPKIVAMSRISAISVSPSTLSLKLNQIRTLKILAVVDGKNIIVPTDMFTLNSSNTSVMQATGLSSIKGIAQGNTTLTVTIPTSNGNKVYTTNVSVFEKINVLDETFESYASEATLSTGTWSMGTVPAGSWVKVIPRPTGAPANGETGKCLHIHVDESSVVNVGTTGTFSPLMEKAEVQFDFMYDKNGGKLIYINGEGANISSFISAAGITSIQSDGTSYTVMSAPVKGKWYQIKLAVDIKNNTVDWYVDGEIKATGKTFRYPARYLNSITFGNFTNGNNTDLYIDNVKVYDK